MVKFFKGNFNGKNWLIGLGVIFVGFQILSILLVNFFPVFADFIRSFQLAWLLIIFTLGIVLVGTLVFKINSLDRKSLFAILLALSLLIAITVYFGLDFGILFDMSVVRSEFASTVKYLGSLITP